MKKITLLFAILLTSIMGKAAIKTALTLPITASTFFASTAITDPTLEKGTIGTGVLGQWNGAAGSTATNAPTVANSTMYYSNYIDNAVGKQIVLNSAPEQSPRYSAFIYSTTTSEILTSSSPYYVSALVNISSITSSGYILCLDKGSSGNGTLRCRLYVTPATGGFQMSVGGSASPTYNSTVYNLNQTYLVVLKYTISNCYMWVNPTLGGSSDDSNIQSTAATGADLVYLKSIDILETTGLSAKISGLRLGTTWSDIAKGGGASLPALTTPSKPNDASSIGGKGFVASWSTVTSAVGYTVNVYNGATLAKTVTVSGQTTASTIITGLTESTAYTYKVIANSDGSANSNSVESEASNTFSTITLVPATSVVGTASDIHGDWFNANWTAQSNVTNYTIKVYDATPALVKTVTTPLQFGGSLASACISGLSLSTTYTYTVTSNGDNIYTSSSTESSPSASITTLANYQTAINTNFADGTWYTVSPATPSLGAYPNPFSANGFDLALAQVTNSTTSSGPKGEVHTHKLVFDKGSSNAMITLPTVASVSQLEIHCASASSARTITVQQYIGSTWTNIGAGSASVTGIYDLPNSTELIYVIPITTNNTNAKFRILSSTTNTGSISIFQIITRTTTPNLLSIPSVVVTDVATNISSTGFTANWSTGDANAQGYKVFVYSGSTLVKTANTANDNTLRSLAISDLTPSTTYTYKVGSIGDGDNLYADSYVSAASASFTTLADIGTGLSVSKNDIVITVVNKTITSSTTANIEIYNLQGSKVAASNNTKSISLNIKSGLYIVRVHTKDGMEKIQKIIIN